ncbi:MAG: PhnD/SsuA/transferrin family substrate-binding protein [Desulfobulbaceae bacterium]|jgi:ABC-type phosphate/phosphonate transport system substrate-binding protein|nr:PhnD/SsuA/transferrin family substrate-binding protein [Desulfobulbaceae bacterium]
MKKNLYHLGLFFMLFFLPLSASGQQEAQEIVLAVLAHSGVEAAHKKWEPTADYLSAAIDGYSFVILPLGFDGIEEATAQGRADFILTNPAAYVDLEMGHGISRIATLVNKQGETATSQFAGVIFTRADRDDINTLADIRGKTIMGMAEQSFGGWLMARRELEDAGINPFKHCREVLFAGIQEPIVLAVAAGQADVGTVRTEIMEGMARRGQIDLADFKIINPLVDAFPYPHSTRFYPEWPFAKAKHTPALLATKVAVALLQMEPDNRAAVVGRYHGWTVPLSYTSVHDLLRQLRICPYEDYGAITLGSVLKKYWVWIFALFLLSCYGTIFSIRNKRLNQQLLHSNQGLAALKNELEEKVAQRTAELQQEVRDHLQAREELEKQQHLLDEVQELTHLGGWNLDVDSGVMTWTKGTYRIYDVSPDQNPDAISNDIVFYSPLDREKIDAAMQTAISQGVPFDLELDLITPKGQSRRVRMIGKVKKRGNKVTHVFGMIMDISAAKEREEELHQANEDLRVINRIITTSAAATGIKDLLGKMLDETLALTSLEGGSICLIEVDDTLVLVAHRQPSEPVSTVPTPQKVKVGGCLCGECARTQKTFILESWQEVQGFPRCELQGGEDIQYHVAFPLSVGSRRLGVLCLFSRIEKQLSARQLGLLESVSTRLPLAWITPRCLRRAPSRPRPLRRRFSREQSILKNPARPCSSCWRIWQRHKRRCSGSTSSSSAVSCGCGS